MPVIIQCPYCPTKVKLSAKVVKATCPECLKSFIPIVPDDSEKTATGDLIGHAKPISEITLESVGELPEEESSMPAWASPWGLAAFTLATVGLLSASVPGVRIHTLVLAATGLVVALLGIPATQGERRTKDRVWLTLGGSLSGWILLMALFTPGLLNNRWALDVAVPRADPDKQVAVPRDQLKDQGRPVTADDGADAATELVRQHDLLVSVEAVKAGRLPDKGKASFLLVQFRLANIGQETITFQGFDRANHQPVLTDSAGRTFVFLEQRQRQQAKGAAVFATTNSGAVPLAALNRQDCLLVFEAPSAGFKTLKLEVPAKLDLPASAWGRNGMVHFRIAGLFEAGLPNSKK
jgi:hypothetical protein